MWLGQQQGVVKKDQVRLDFWVREDEDTRLCEDRVNLLS